MTRNRYHAALLIMAIGAGDAAANPMAMTQALLGSGAACYALDSTWTPQWSNIVGYWTLDGSGAVANGATVLATVGSNGTATNANGSGLAYVPGRLSQGLTFDGLDDGVAIPNLNLTGDMSVTLWINPSSTQVQYADILSQHSPGGFALEQNSSSTNQYYFAWGNGSTYTCTGATYITLTANQWQHVAISKSGATVTLYRNAVQTGSCTGAFSGIATNSDSFYLGRWSSGGTRHFAGTIDDVAVWSSALAATDVKQIYDQQSCGQN